MGWSCTRDAGVTHDAMIAICRESTGSSNEWAQRDGRFFFETGDEQADGSIVGEVYRMTSTGRARFVRNFKISPDGRIAEGGYLERCAAARVGKGEKISEREIERKGGAA